MSCLYPIDLEGPPSPDDMDSLCRDLVFDGKHEKAHRVARIMIDNYLGNASTAEDGHRQFYYWLGVRSVTGMLVGRIETRRFDRQLKKGVRHA